MNALLTALILVAAAPRPWTAGETCVVSKSLKVEVPGAKPRSLPKGTSVEVLSVTRKVVQIRAGELTGKVKLPTLSKGCVRPKLAKGKPASGALPDLPPLPDELPPIPPAAPSSGGGALAAGDLPPLPPDGSSSAGTESLPALPTEPVPPPPSAVTSTFPTKPTTAVKPTTPPPVPPTPSTTADAGHPALRKGNLTVSSSQDGAAVYVDGKLVGTTPVTRLALAEGPHRLSVDKRGFTQFDTEVVIKPDGAHSVEALLEPIPGATALGPSPSSGRRTVGKVVTALGAAAIAGAAVVYVMAGQQASDLSKDIDAYNLELQAGTATAAQASALEDRRKKIATLDTLTLAAGVAGLVATGTGIYLWASSPSRDAATSVRVGAAPVLGGQGGLVFVSGGF